MKANGQIAPKKLSWILLALALCLATGAVEARQVSSLLPGSKPAATTAPTATAPVDPQGLGRETPRGTIVGFIRMAQEENERAAEYFQPPAKGHRVTAEEEQELAKQLYTVLNANQSCWIGCVELMRSGGRPVPMMTLSQIMPL